MRMDYVFATMAGKESTARSQFVRTMAFATRTHATARTSRRNSIARVSGDREIRYNLCLCVYNSTILNASNNSDGYLVPTTMAPSTTLAPGTRAFAFIIDVAGNESVVFNTIMVCNNW